MEQGNGIRGTGWPIHHTGLAGQVRSEDPDQISPSRLKLALVREGVDMSDIISGIESTILDWHQITMDV